ncbi:MAG: hypothetical protein P8I03_15690 [Thalassotalea sp.]|nr:hypothetical protein [Thalassotalea sp.]
MTEQTSLWQDDTKTADFAELCNALYEREIMLLANSEIQSPQVFQGRLKSLPYYIKRTAHLMFQAKTPLAIDVQNASWSAKQGGQMPLKDQDIEAVNQWYLSINLTHGLVVPIVNDSFIVLDSIDRIDKDKNRFRTNVHGWFYLDKQDESENNVKTNRLLKPNKRVMTAACTGHSWLNDQKVNPHIPTLRELLLSCAINWRNFKQPAFV